MRRRARLQRVEEEVRRRVVVGFFDTLYHARKFKRHMDLKRTAVMTAIPQLGVPDILVDDEDQRDKKKSVMKPYGPMSPGTPSSLGNAPLHSPSTFLSPTRNSAGSQHHKTLSTTSADLTLQTNFDNFGAHPLSMPRAGGEGSSSFQRQGGYDGHQSTHSAFSFELQEPGSGSNSRNNSRNNSRRNSRSNSAVSPSQMSQILDDSIWMASIRRSATQKRPQSKW